MPDVISVEDFYGGVPFPQLQAADRSRPDGTSILDTPVSAAADIVGSLPSDSGLFETIKAAAEKYGVPVQYAFALANQESGYNPKAVGPDTAYGNAKGMFQYIDDTAQALGIDAFDPVQSADAAMRQFAERMNTKGIDWAIAAHFAGDDKRQHGTKTRQYLADVTKRAKDIQALLAEGKEPTEKNIEKQTKKDSNILSVDEFYAQLNSDEVTENLSPPPAPKKDEPWYQPVVDAAENTFDAAMRRVKKEFPSLRTPEEEEEFLRTGRTITIGGDQEDFERLFSGEAGLQEFTKAKERYPEQTLTMSAEPSIDRRLRWQQIVNENPSRIKDVPKDLLLDIAHNSEQVRGFVANLKNPLELFLNESMPANVVSFYANLPERARKRFDEARQIAMQENIVANPDKFPAVAVEAAQRAIDQRKKSQDPSIRQMWDALKQAAKEDPGKFGADLVNAMIADPEMLFAPIGMGAKPIQTARTLAKGAEVTSKASRIADRVLDAGATAGSINAAIEIAHGAAIGDVNKKDIAISTALGAALGGPFGLLFRNSAEARAILNDPAKAKLAGVYDDALRDAAKADVEIENTLRETSPESFANAPAVRKLLGLPEEWESTGYPFAPKKDADTTKFIAAYRKQVRAAIKDNLAYRDYLEYVAEERMSAAAAKAEAATQEQVAAAQQAVKDLTTEAAYDAQRAARQAEWRDNFDRAVEARDAQELERVMAEASAENADRLYIQKLDADDAMQAAVDSGIPQIKRMLNKAAKRDRLLNMPKGQRGEADPKLLARLAAVGAGGTAAYALAPEDEKVASGLAGALAGLILPAGGTVLSRMRQSGAISLDGSLVALPMRAVRKGMTAEEDAAARAAERQIIEAARNGNQDAMKEIYTKYFPYIQRVTANFLRDAGPRLAIDAEDIAQETMIKVLNNLEKFEGNSEFSTWVHAIGKNEALQAIRKSQSRPMTESMDSTLRYHSNDMAELGELPYKVEETNPSTYDTPENMAVLEDVQNQVSHAFSKMPEDIRLTMILKELEGFSEQEVADKLGVPLGTVKSRLSRGRKMVEEGLEKGWGAKPAKKNTADDLVTVYHTTNKAAADQIRKLGLRGFSPNQINKKVLESHGVTANNTILETLDNYWMADSDEFMDAIRGPYVTSSKTRAAEIAAESSSEAYRALSYELAGYFDDIGDSVKAKAIRDKADAIGTEAQDILEIKVPRDALKPLYEDQLPSGDLSNFEGDLLLKYGSIRPKGQRGEVDPELLKLGAGAGKPTVVPAVPGSIKKPGQLTGYRRQKIGTYEGVSSGNTEGDGIYIFHNKNSALGFQAKNSSVKPVYYDSPKKPLITEELPLLDQDEIFNPITSNDSFWMKLNKESFQEASQLGGNESEIFKRAGSILTKKLLDQGYDAVVYGGIDDPTGWTVLLRDKSKGIQPYGQRGEIDPRLLKAGAGVGLGGLAGAYFANRSEGDPLGGAAAGAILGGVIAKNPGALPRLIKHMYGSASTTILEKAPPIYRRIMTMERRMLTDTHKNIEAGVPFFKALRKLPQPDQDVVARALMTGDANVIQKVLKAAGNTELIKAYGPLRKVLDNLGSQLEARNLIRRTGIEYFPRMVVDKEGLFKAIGKEDKSKIEVALHAANIESIRKQGRTLNAIEESALINKILFTDKNKSRPGWSRNRGIEEITPELQPFYASPVESFNTYVRSAVEEIEKAKFFGKHAIKNKEGRLEYINTDTSASKMMADWIKEGKLSPDDARELADLIKSRFGGGSKGEPALIRDLKSLGNMGLLGNFWSAVTQLGDVGGILYTQGFRPTLQTLAKRATGKKYVDMKNFGLADHISEEFANQSRLARWTNKVFKASLFSGVDKVGKTTTLNAALQRAKNSIASEQGEIAFRKKYSGIFGDDIDTLVQDIKKGNYSSDVAQDFAFMELERFQPITRTSFPQFYLDHPNFRSYLWLQSWTMKQFDILRRDGLNQMKNGNVARGLANLTKAALVMGAANTGMQSIRDWLLGKDIELDWGTIALNTFRNYGWSEFESRKFFGVTKEEAREARQEGERYARAQKAEPITTAAKRVTPAYQVFERALQGRPKDYARMIPLVGPYLAERFKEAEEFERDMKRRHPDRRD